MWLYGGMQETSSDVSIAYIQHRRDFSDSSSANRSAVTPNKTTQSPKQLVGQEVNVYGEDHGNSSLGKDVVPISENRSVSLRGVRDNANPTPRPRVYHLSLHGPREETDVSVLPPCPFPPPDLGTYSCSSQLRFTFSQFDKLLHRGTR